MRFWNVLLLLAIHVLSVAAAGNYTGVTSGTNLPYIVHFPLSSVSPPYPAVIFLHGSGSVGTVSDLDNNAFWDGVGKLCSDYDSGSGDAAAKEAVENYLIILPLCTASYCSGDQRQWEPADVLQVLDAVKASYAVDADRVTISGYSMGGKGTWTTAMQSPTSFSSLITSAGYDEFNSSLSALTSALVQPLVTADMAFQCFVGTDDVKQPIADAQPVLDILKDLNANYNETTISGADHTAMSTAPYELTTLWDWVAKQSRSGGSSTVTSNTSASTDNTPATGSTNTSSQAPLPESQSTDNTTPASPNPQPESSPSPTSEASPPSPMASSPTSSTQSTPSATAAATSTNNTLETVIGGIALLALLALFLVFAMHCHNQRKDGYRKTDDSESDSETDDSDDSD